MSRRDGWAQRVPYHHKAVRAEVPARTIARVKPRDGAKRKGKAEKDNMPLYEYYCENCDGVFEAIRQMREASLAGTLPGMRS